MDHSPPGIHARRWPLPQQHAASAVDKNGTAGPKSTEHEQLMASLRATDEKFASKVRQINAQVEEERRTLLASLEKKRTGLLNEAGMEHHREKFEIMNRAPSSNGSCSLCDAPIKVAAAQCIEEGCGGTVCKSCLRSKIDDSVRCHICTDVINVMCPPCLEARMKKRGWYQFDFCREYCGFICPDHTCFESCCVCGRRPLCSSPKGKCSFPECGRCGEKLCGRCDSKEGCMCVG